MRGFFCFTNLFLNYQSHLKIYSHQRIDQKENLISLKSSDLTFSQKNLFLAVLVSGVFEYRYQVVVSQNLKADLLVFRFQVYIDHLLSEEEHLTVRYLEKYLHLQTYLGMTFRLRMVPVRKYFTFAIAMMKRYLLIVVPPLVFDYPVLVFLLLAFVFLGLVEVFLRTHSYFS